MPAIMDNRRKVVNERLDLQAGKVIFQQWEPHCLCLLCWDRNEQGFSEIRGVYPAANVEKFALHSIHIIEQIEYKASRLPFSKVR